MTSQNDKKEFPPTIAATQSLHSANQQNLGMNMVHIPSSSLTIPSGMAASLSAPLHLQTTTLHPNGTSSIMRPGTTPIAPAPQPATLPNASFPIPRDSVMYGNNGQIQMQSFSQAARLRRKDQSSPAVFQNCKLRSGKWIQEEEDYAKVLIELFFEKGELTDCENGATLRSYLSLKLHCPPMRISKKFARQGIGKLVFLSKLNVGVSIPSSKIEQNNKRVQEAENKFYQAVFPTNGVLATFDGFLAASTLAAATVPMVPGIVPILAPPIIPPPILPFVPVGGNGQTVFPVPMVVSNPNNETVASNETKPSLPTQAVHTGISSEHTRQLQESYLKALLGQHQPTNFTPQATAPVTVQAGGPLTQNPPQVALEATQTVAAKPLALAPLTHPSLHAPRPFQTKKDEGLASDDQTCKPESALPDLLADFDLVALRLKQDVSRPAHDGTKSEPSMQTPKDPQYSPPFTSRSFDDLHRLLGKDLSPLHDEGDDQKDICESGKAVPEALVPTSSVAFTAESYALLAQESAMLASQHAAYLPQSVARLVKKERGSSFDFEGTVNIVSSGFHRRPSTETSNRHVSLKSKREEREEASKLNEKVGLTPVERLYGSRQMNFISEPSSAAESESHLSSQRGSAEESNGSENASNDESGETSGSSNDSEEYYDSNSDEGPPRKRTKGSFDEDDHLQENAAGSGVTSWRSMLHHR